MKLHSLALVLVLLGCSACEQAAPGPLANKPAFTWVEPDLAVMSNSPSEWAGAKFSDESSSPWPHFLKFIKLLNIASRDSRSVELTDTERQALHDMVLAIHQSNPMPAQFRTNWEFDGQQFGGSSLMIVARLMRSEAQKLRESSNHAKADEFANALFVLGWSFALTPVPAAERETAHSAIVLVYTRAIESLSADRQLELEPFSEQLKQAQQNQRDRLNRGK
jgi:hypothetical protein